MLDGGVPKKSMPTLVMNPRVFRTVPIYDVDPADLLTNLISWWAPRRGVWRCHRCPRNEPDHECIRRSRQRGWEGRQR